MSVSRVRENRKHGSMRRREATPDQSATAARPPDASRRPYTAATQRSTVTSARSIPRCGCTRRVRGRGEARLGGGWRSGRRGSSGNHRVVRTLAARRSVPVAAQQRDGRGSDARSLPNPLRGPRRRGGASASTDRDRPANRARLARRLDHETPRSRARAGIGTTPSRRASLRTLNGISPSLGAKGAGVCVGRSAGFGRALAARRARFARLW